MRYALFILYVKDQQASRDFYCQVLGLEPSLDVPGMTEFRLTDSAVLGLMPQDGIAKLICPEPDGQGLASGLPCPSIGHGIPRCELYLPSPDPSAALARAVAAGGSLLSAQSDRSWGESVGYAADLDGHVLAFAQDPGLAPAA